MKLFRELDKKEEQVFREWAQDNYKPFMDIKGIWHPIVQEECIKINKDTELKLTCTKYGAEGETLFKYEGT